MNEVMKPLTIELGQITTIDGFNVRQNDGDIRSLAASIKENGLKQPLRVQKLTEKTKDGSVMYAVTDGHRRFAAMSSIIKTLGSDFAVPVMVEPKEYTDEQRNIDLIVANDAQPLTLFEQGLVFTRLKADGMKDAAIAKRCGKTQPHVADCLLLMKAPDSLKKQLMSGTVSASAVIELMKTEGAENAAKVVDKAVEENPNKRVTNKHLTKAAGKAVGKAAGKEKAVEKAVAAKAEKETKPTPPPVRKPVAASDTDALAKLEELKAALDANKKNKDFTPKLESFSVLTNLIKWLKGDIKASTLTGLFFLTEEDAAPEDKKGKK